MAETETAPRYEALVSLSDAARRGWLAGVATRTYALVAGRLVLADHQRPLTLTPCFDLGDDGEATTLVDDSDLVGPKVATDVVVTGTVRLETPASRHEVAVGIGRSQRRAVLLGARRVAVSSRGEVSFDDPSTFDTIDLGLARAFGGYDDYAHRALAPPKQGMPLRPGPFAYPRNPMGSGWLIDLDRRRADGMALPQIEDPTQPLYPSQLFVSNERAWLDAPAPGNLGWLPHHCYPRLERLTGPLTTHETPRHRVFETTFEDGDDLPCERMGPRGLQGAAPGLAVERLRGDELVIMRGLLPGVDELRFALPRERPKITITMPNLGKRTPEPILQTVRLDLDRRTVSLTWFGGLRTAVAIPEAQVVQCALAVRHSKL